MSCTCWTEEKANYVGLSGYESSVAYRSGQKRFNDLSKRAVRGGSAAAATREARRRRKGGGRERVKHRSVRLSHARRQPRRNAFRTTLLFLSGDTHIKTNGKKLRYRKRHSQTTDRIFAV